MTQERVKKRPPAHLLDMDGVLVRGGEAVDKSADYIQILIDEDVPFIVFSNNSRFTPEVMATRLQDVGFPITHNNVFTSAQTTAHFISQQKPGASCFVIGEDGLKSALDSEGLVFNDTDPDYVVVGESVNYNFPDMARGSQLIAAGATFLGSNPDKTIPVEQGVYPACGAACALIEKATGVKPYFLGKPNPFMMRSALDRLGVKAQETIMVGDRLDTDIRAGMELGLKTALVLTGASTRAELVKYPYKPDIIVDRLFDLCGIFDIGYFSKRLDAKAVNLQPIV